MEAGRETSWARRGRGEGGTFACVPKMSRNDSEKLPRGMPDRSWPLAW